MKTIMIFVPFMTGYGGTETVIKNLFAEYNKKDDQKTPKLILSSIGGTINQNWLKDIKNLQVINLSRHKLIRKGEYLLSLFFILNHQIRKKRPQIVISNSYIIWYCLTLLKRIFKYEYQVLAWYHFSLESHQVPPKFLKAADGYLVISTGISHQLQQYGIPDEKINVIFNPINKTDNAVARSQPDTPTEFLYVGRVMLFGQKNLHELFDALNQVSGSWHLTIYGVGEIAAAQAYVDKLDMTELVDFKGFSANLWSKIKVCDALVLTSVFEGLPMVLNEAISNGIPVISSDCDTGPDDIVNVDNGFLYKSGQTTQLTAELQKFVSRTVDFTDDEKIKQSIRKFYSDNYFDVFMQALNKYME
ncbi:glycosyltransferase [Fructilactobacillus florum]|uniref:glycosyltransferase n=1 Tax=Fructilactobacillus florum TaxID=640331 RepID=UPI00028DB573|nr:glycosyltransferase [Fructilactobacillus florum]EKK21026.1 lipopolysaccharide 1, 6-galactosyltransferase [Fructilactobacillus florum 2F]